MIFFSKKYIWRGNTTYNNILFAINDTFIYDACSILNDNDEYFTIKLYKFLSIYGHLVRLNYPIALNQFLIISAKRIAMK